MKSQVVLLSTILLLVSTEARAGLTLGDYLGIASTLIGVGEGLIPKTEITPAYAIKEWSSVVQGEYCEFAYYTKRTITRNALTGDFVYYTKEWNGVAYVESNATFAVVGTAVRNYYCDRSSDACFYWDYQWEAFSIEAWIKSIQKSGINPPGQPYSAFLKTDLLGVQRDCNPPVDNWPNYYMGFTLNDVGRTTIVPMMNPYAYEWPVLMWVGKEYDY
jgi:hypothetical protein